MESKPEPFPESQKAQFDSDELLDRIEGDTELFKEVVHIFLEDTPGLISTLCDGVAKENEDAVEKAAHAIKGASAMISAKKLEELAHQMEMMGRERALKGADAVLHNIIECFDDLKKVMASCLENMGSVGL